MVDFPEGYGFAPNHGAKIMQESFMADIGVYSRKASGWTRVDRSRSPYHFESIGCVRKKDNDTPIRGILFVPFGMPDEPTIEGTLQQVVTALCTIHRMRGHMK